LGIGNIEFEFGLGKESLMMKEDREQQTTKEKDEN
jgi:hypothetical protein